MLQKAGSYSVVLGGVLALIAWGCTDKTNPTSSAGTGGAAGGNATTTGGSGGNVAGTGGSGGSGGISGSGGTIGSGGNAGNAGDSGGTGGGGGGDAATATGGTGDDAGDAGGTGDASGADGSAQQTGCVGAYQFSAVAEGGSDMSLCDCKGDVLLIVNIASNCAFTPQLTGLVQLQTSYKDQGFSVLGFWNNQFLAQMGDATRRDAVKTQYAINFPLFEEIYVNAPNEDPLYTWLKAEAGGGDVGWNFEKFLIGRDGSVIKRYLTQVTPESIAPDIEAALK